MFAKSINFSVLVKYFSTFPGQPVTWILTLINARVLMRKRKYADASLLWEGLIKICPSSRYILQQRGKTIC